MTRTYLFIDYKAFVDVVKFRIYRMRQSVEELIKRDFESRGYVCGSCGAFFGSLEVGRLVNPRTGLLECDVCPGVELESALDKAGAAKPAEGSKDSSDPHNLHARLMEQTRPIVDLLKLADALTIPAFNAHRWYEQNQQKYITLGVMAHGIPADGASAAQFDSLATPPTELPGSSTDRLQVTVELAATAQEPEPDSQATASLPDWHLYSTVTGEAIRPSTSTDHAHGASAPPGPPASTNEDILQYYQNLLQQDLPSASPEEPPAKLARAEPVTAAVLVSVAGELKPLPDITDDDKDRMTEDEYAKYYEACMSSVHQ